MQKYIYIGCGGFAGAIIRYSIKQIQIQNYYERIPLDTLFINISGAFLLAFILTAASKAWKINANMQMGITVGFLGAYTTFSTFCKETVLLIQSGDYFAAFFYVIISVALGFGAACLGMKFAHKIKTAAS
ncbi:fluoride efflux transporter CrcB [Sinanaerobacter sp. ZZT-01]|uniref:fluoride efflux transporter CrcB n=1 Tax=Sinanaerobacter sp. ZZT-01 TaxID=3111540 RepID=UPI002D79215C|nr:fluoride efflux transporter CrcB [Sinanaerobacter sp. ZZT-01]WRR94500.1 fluoride efflux transporter CrcB [Sinanaerobacter sp. ZZT-01]